MNRLQENYSLKKLNSFAIDANARFFYQPQTVFELIEFLKNQNYRNIPKLILGQGSNILFCSNFDGIVIQPVFKGKEVLYENNDMVIIRANAGESWDEWVSYCVEKGWYGLENLSNIPGTVGAAPVQNIGAYGVEVKDYITNVEALLLQNGRIKILSKKECAFGYRNSIFKNELKDHAIITSVIFKLSKKPVYNTSYKDLDEELNNYDELNQANVRNAVIAIRTRKLPDIQKIPNAGSFFKNPIISEKKAKSILNKYPDVPLHKQVDNTYKIPAAWLIDKCGWKGKRIGNVGVHKKHALILVNYGNASGQEILNLAESIKESVAELFNILIEFEVNIV